MKIFNSVKTKKKFNTFMVYVSFFLVSLIILIPILFALVSSMRTNVEIFSATAPFSIRTFVPETISIESYINLFTKWEFHVPLFNTLRLAITSIVIGVFINSLAGFAFAMFDFKFKNILFTFVFLSFMVPFEALAIPVYGIVSDMGLLNTFSALLMPTLANGLVIYLFKQFFEELPNSIMEAALVDGAPWWRIFFQLALPISKPVIISGCLLTFVTQWSAFLWPLVAARSDSLKVIQVAMSEFMQQYATFWSEMFAAATISIIIPMLLMLPLQKYYVLSMTSAGEKG